MLPFDDVPPEIVGASLAPAQVDVTSAPATITVRVHLRDTGTGIDSSSALVGITTERGGGTCFARTLVSRNRNDGTWECTVTIPQGARPGQWTLGRISTMDLAFNATWIDAEQAAPLSPGVTVTNANADVTPPTITSVSFSPASVDITGHAATTTVTVAASDAGSGVDTNGYNYLAIKSPTR